MANDAKKVSELGVTQYLAANDRILVLTNPASAPNTQTVTVTDFANGLITSGAMQYAGSTRAGVVKIGNYIDISTSGVISINTANSTTFGVVMVGTNLTVNNSGYTGVTVTGPYADDTAASGGGVALNSLYYDASGNVKIRLS